jgi:hypothetical protein
MRKQKFASHRRKPFIAAALGLVIVVVLTWLLIAHWHRKPTAYTNNQSHTTGGQYTKGEGGAGSTDGSTANGGSSTSTTTGGDKSQTGDTGSTSGAIITPTGNFVSAHHISHNDNPTMQSSCQTTPNVPCRIIFTNGEAVRELASETTDPGGSAYWTWYPKDIGLTTGTWKVQATAGFASNSVTATDALNLEVAP